MKTILSKSVVVLILVWAVSMLLLGCSTVVEGRDQPLTLITDPPGAKCLIKKKGQIVGVVESTPGTVTVRKSNTDLEYMCSKKGYYNAAGVIDSSFAGWTLGNILVGGLIGLGIDAASGAINKYEDQATIVMIKKN